jgi:hypothetical protein
MKSYNLQTFIEVRLSAKRISVSPNIQRAFVKKLKFVRKYISVLFLLNIFESSKKQTLSSNYTLRLSVKMDIFI